MTRQFIWRSVLAGLLAGAGILLAVCARVVYTINAGHRWHIVREFLGVKWKS